MPGSHTVRVPNSHAHYLDSSAGRHRCPYPPHSAGSCAPGGLSSWKGDGAGCKLNPRVEAEPHVFEYQFSGFSGWEEPFVDGPVQHGQRSAKNIQLLPSSGFNHETVPETVRDAKSLSVESTDSLAPDLPAQA